MRRVLWVGCFLAFGCGASVDEPQGSTDDSFETAGSAPTTGEGSTSSTSVVSATSSTATSSSGTTGTTETSGSTTGGSSSTTGSVTWADIEGDCGVLGASELAPGAPASFGNAIDFLDVGFDYEQLTPGARSVHDAGNLNAGSLLSEVVAFETLARCEEAELVKTEGDIVYEDPDGTKTDLLVRIDGVVIGVSVTRAFDFPPEDPYTPQQAEALLTDKLGDVLASTANVSAEDAWQKQILHVIAYAPMHAQSVETAYASIDAALRADTVVMVTVTNGNDAFVYE